MAEVSVGGNSVPTNGELPAVGSQAPAFTVTKDDMSDVSLGDYAGKRVVLSLFPSIDTPTCAQALRTFNQRAVALDNTVVLNVSADLPFAMKRFCAAEGIDNVEVGSTFRHPETLSNYGVALAAGPVAGLSARAVVVIDSDGSVLHSQLVPQLGDEPDYDAAIAALS
jgi:thioredoxin-dependent peroxiredoxin